MKVFDEILMKMKEDPEFMTAGRRNDDTVNLLITCQMLKKDPDDVLMEEFDISYSDFDLYVDHRERIEPYLESWCSDKDEALSYMIWTSDYMKGIN